MALRFCGCSHAEGLHHPAGRCTETLPASEEEELPAWRCPCRGFRAVPDGATAHLELDATPTPLAS